MIYAHSTETPCCDVKPVAAAPSASPVAHQQPSPLPAPPVAQAPPLRVASAAEMKSLTADAPTAAQSFPFALPAGVAPENGLQVKTIWAARAISLLFPQITTIGGDCPNRLRGGPHRVGVDLA